MNDVIVNAHNSIGIIGGADGPTAVFITGNPIGLIVAAVVVLTVVGVIIWKLFKN